MSPISALVIFRFGARGDDGARAIGANDDAAAVGATGSTAPTPLLGSHVDWSPAFSLSDISGWRDGVLYPLAGGGRGIRRGAFWLRGLRLGLLRGAAVPLGGL